MHETAKDRVREPLVDVAIEDDHGEILGSQIASA
jgi:hypothetical protein